MKLLPLFTVLGLSCHAGAAVLSSLDLPSVDRNAEVSYNQWLASAFTAGPEAEPMLVQDISIRLNWFQPNAYPCLAITGSLGGKPDLGDVRVLADMSPLGGMAGSTSVYTLTFQPDLTQGEPLLEGDQDYWLVFGFTAPDFDADLPAGLSHWSYASTGAGLQAFDGWSLLSKTATANTAGQNWSTELTTPYSLGITLVPVPEPGGGGLLLGAALLHLGSRRRGTGTI